MQVAQSKLASYIFPLFFPVAICLGFYFDTILASSVDGSQNEKLSTNVHRVFSFLTGFVLLIGCGAALYFIPKYGPAFHSERIGYFFATLLFVCAASLIFFSLRKDFVKSFWLAASVIGVLLIPLSFSYQAAEPWVSCKQICEVFNKIDPSKDVILTSKFYVRGVHYYTDRPVAVIDINGDGFFSPHPIPFLSTDEQVLEFLKQRPVTYCIVKRNQWKDLERITKDKFKIIFFQEIGGKYILRIDHLSSPS